LRTTAAMRSLVAETSLRPENLIAPFFVVPGRGQEQAIAALPGISRYSVERLLPRLERGLELGVKAVLLFGVPEGRDKDATGLSAGDPDGPVPTAIREARRAFGNDVVIMTDVCLCAYTDHGHCGLLKATPRGLVVDNNSSLPGLAAMALAHARAGADMVAPSDMMDGRVGYLRGALDRAGFVEVGILSYAVKFASAYYGPFREAAGSAPRAHPDTAPHDTVPHDTTPHDMTPPKDRTSYQMDMRNAREALREAALDEKEGADMLMVKPALAYLDVIAKVRAASKLPLAAYNVSGEYAMLKHAAEAGALDEATAVNETLSAMRRAGADLIISYHALEALEKGWL
ncbi:MAG: porphobilinogen synthase, partial [Deinococcota bacterium]|nr:porphobilinogen synthase [Deinococcota bacterium]